MSHAILMAARTLRVRREEAPKYFAIINTVKAAWMKRIRALRLAWEYAAFDKILASALTFTVCCRPLSRRFCRNNECSDAPYVVRRQHARSFMLRHIQRQKSWWRHLNAMVPPIDKLSSMTIHLSLPRLKWNTTERAEIIRLWHLGSLECRAPMNIIY